jgi:acyl-CoA synthetase (AMP-forming)/AMP-acid ligase II
MTPVKVVDRFPRAAAERIALYRANGLWHNRVLADGVEAAAARRPTAVAVADNSSALTYAELASAVAAALATLAAHGVGGGDGVVLVAGNTVPGVIAYHALLRAGATLVALDRRCGAADLRVAFDAIPHRPRVIIAAGEAERLGDALDGVEVIPLEAFGDGGAVPGQALPGRALPGLAEPDRDRTAVILFSSGTTSRPKGVLHSLNTLTAGAANMARITSSDQTTVCFLVSPLTSITGLMQVHLTADCHATLVLEDHFEPEQTLRRANAAGATLLGGAPVIAERLLRAATGERHGADRNSASRGRAVSFRTLALGGAMLPRPLLELAMDRFGIEIARVYGSSEAPNFSGSVAGDDREARLSDDGLLMAGSEVLVGSANHPSEGLLRGPNVFLGYLDAADNADAFACGWYRSGDQVELNDGRLTVVGRLKEIVNRNGLKISLPETDAALDGLPGVTESASFGMPDPDTGERLAIAVLLEPGALLKLTELVAYLREAGAATRKLPEQLVRWNGPLPRTASGKIVRSRLAMEAPAQDYDLAARLTKDDDAQ